MIGAHASYVQGAVSEAIGNVTGSADWQKSGQSVKESAVEDMRAASAVDKSQPPAENPTFGGKVEAALGNAVGCEGMVDDGKRRDANPVEGGYGGQEELADKFASTSGEH